MELLNKIQRELKVPKSQFNAFAKYNYRNCEDILEAVKPLLGEGTLTLSDEVVEVGGRCYVKATATLRGPISEGESKNLAIVQNGFVSGMQSWTATAYAREALDKKGMDEAQITGATSSYARKYALCGLFAIDDGQDADKDDNSAPKAVLKKPAALDNDLKAKKTTISKLLKEAAAADPTNLFDELKSKEDFEGACVQYAGLALTDENADAIIEKLSK